MEAKNENSIKVERVCPNTDCGNVVWERHTSSESSVPVEDGGLGGALVYSNDRTFICRNCGSSMTRRITKTVASTTETETVVK